MTYRPKKVRLVCAVAAISIVVLFSVIGMLLTNANFQPGDKYAMIGLGALFGAGVMLIARPSVTADAEGIKVQNIISGYRLPWAAIEKVSFDRGRPWVSLELINDDTVSVLAVQATDKERALEAVRWLRSLHEQARTPVC